MFEASSLKKELRIYADPERAKSFVSFFKAQKGEYAEGDKFIGVKVPDIRKTAKKYMQMDFSQLDVERNCQSRSNRSRRFFTKAL